MERARRGNWVASRRRIVEAARDLFAERGYRGATTREVAEAAGLSERTLFNHFATKAELFEAAVSEPVKEFFAQIAEGWRSETIGHGEPDPELRRFYGGLLQLLERDRRLLMALIAAGMFAESPGDEEAELGASVTPGLEEFERVLGIEMTRRGMRADPAIASRLMFGLVLSVALHPELIFGPGGAPPRDVLIDEMTKLTLWGFAGPP